MPEFALQIRDIDESGKSYEFELSPSWLDTALADAQLRADGDVPGGLQVRAQKNGAEYLVEGRVQAALLAECCRCLGPAKLAVDTRFVSLFKRQAGTAASSAREPEVVTDEDDEDEDLSREEFSGHEIALDGLLREYLVLECPMQPLCSPDCQGIALPEHVRPPADVFGNTARGVDPRLAPLARLRDKIPPNKE